MNQQILKIWSCQQCKYIVHSWPYKKCRKHNKEIPTINKIPEFCHLKEAIYEKEYT